MPTAQSHVTFSDLATATYCPRKLYYSRREDDRSPPEQAADAQRLATQYPGLLVASDTALGTFDLAVPPDAFRANLQRAARCYSDRWPELAVPSETDVLLTGKDCRGKAGKILAGTGPAPESDADSSTTVESHRGPMPTLVSPGQPPEEGVWAPQGVRAVAAAKALSWREQVPVEAAFVEYPFHGVIRRVRMTTRRKAVYRRTLRTVRGLDGPPPRIHDDAKCGACEYRATCGVKTRSLRSMLP